MLNRGSAHDVHDLGAPNGCVITEMGRKRFNGLMSGGHELLLSALKSPRCIAKLR